MTKRATQWPIYVPVGTKNVGTAAVRDERAIPGYAQKKLAEMPGTKPHSEFDDIASCGEPVKSLAPAARKTASPREAATKALQALGRLRDGEQNATERRYEAHLEQQKQAGEILWYLFEGIKLKLAPKTFLTVDYAVMSASGQLEMHDVKGARAIFSDDAKVKMKVAADKFPFVFKVAFPKKRAGGWEVEEI